MAISESIDTLHAEMTDVLSHEVDSAALSALVRTHVSAAFEQQDAPFYLGALEFENHHWSFVLHRRGIDLFRVRGTDGMSVSFERKSLPPLRGADCREETIVFIVGGATHCARVKHPLLHGEELVIRGRCGAPIFELLRTWARDPLSSLELVRVEEQ